MRRHLLVPLVLSIATLTSPAFGDAMDDAIAKAKDARTLFEEERYDEAYTLFAEADGLVHSPVFVLYMARSRQHVGRLLEAQRLYERLVDEDLPEDATAPMKKAREDARDELARLRLRLPAITISAPGAGVARVDGEAVDLDVPLELDPGDHVVEIERDGAVERVEVTLREGERRPVTFDAPIPDDAPRPEATSGPWWPGALLVGVGGAGLVVGGVTGGLALDRASAAKAGCIGTSCLRRDATTADEARTFATVSTVAFVAGGVLAATGIVLLAVRPGGDEGGDVALRWTGTGAALSGTF